MRWRVLAVPVAAVTFLGCGSGGPSLVPVSGTVTYNGKPLGGADIVFVPLDQKQPQTPGGDVTGPEGNYKAMYQGRAGLAPGKYKVYVSKKPEVPSNVPADLQDDPYMASLSGAAVAEVDPGKSAIEKTAVEREVPTQGGTVDVDIKGPASKDQTAAK
jgi:hypothetical protein